MDFNYYSYNENKDFDDIPDAKDQIKSGLKNKFNILIIILLSAACTIAYVDNVMRIDSLMRDNNNMSRQLKDLEYRNIDLESRIHMLESPERIIPIASEKIGMIKNDKSPVIINE